MARFDVFAYESSEAPFVVEIQSDMFAALATTVVLPLVPFDRYSHPMDRLTPIIEFANHRFAIVTTDMSAVSRSSLGVKAGNISDNRQAIIDAVDFLLQGF